MISYSTDCRFLPVSCSFSIILGSPTSGFLPAFKCGGDGGGVRVAVAVVVVTWLVRAEATSWNRLSGGLFAALWSLDLASGTLVLSFSSL